MTFSIADSKGKTCWSITKRNTGGLPNPYKRKVSLAPGSYVLTVTSTADLHGELRFEVKDTKPDQPVVRLTVR